MVAITTFSEPTSRVRHRQPNTTVYVNDNSLGKGILYIAESYLSWCSDSGNGFTLEYPHISLHAISRDLTAFPQECIFMMLDTDFNGDAENNSSEDEEAEDQVSTQLRLVPDDKGMLDAMFHALNICQSLHPDPQESFSDEDFFEDADEDLPMEETDSRMANLRIRNMDEIPCSLEHPQGEMEEDRAEGLWSNRVGGIWEDRLDGIEENRVGGLWEDRNDYENTTADMEEGIFDDSNSEEDGLPSSE